jgi:hypothetical protein
MNLKSGVKPPSHHMVTRKSKGHVTIAHIADLRPETLDELENFGSELFSVGVDVICISGSALLDEKSLLIVKEKLEDWCAQSKVDLFGCVFLCSELQEVSEILDKSSVSVVASVWDELSRLLRSDDILFSHPEGPAIGIRIACIDEVDKEKSATVIRQLLKKPKPPPDMDGDEFNVCLIHRSHLQVTAGLASDENVISLAAMHKETCVLLSGSEKKASLKTFEKTGNYAPHRVHISEACPLASVNKTYQYNVIRLHATGNITSSNRVMDVSRSLDYSDLISHTSMNDDRLRLYRHEARHRHLRNIADSANQRENRSQWANAHCATRIFRIERNGDADVTVRLEKITPFHSELSSIRLHSTNNLTTMRSPKCRIVVSRSSLGTQRNVSVQGEVEQIVESGNETRRTICVRFDPPIMKGESVDVSVSYKLKRAFSFKMKSYDDSSTEYVYTRCATIFPDHIKQAVAFPADWAPAAQPRAHVCDKHDREDAEETFAAHTRLVNLGEENISVLSIEKPLPGLYYGILWEKDEPGAGTSKVKRLSLRQRGMARSKRR